MRGLIPMAARHQGSRPYDVRLLERLAMVRFGKESRSSRRIRCAGPNDSKIAVRNAGLPVSEIGGTRSCLAGRNWSAAWPQPGCAYPQGAQTTVTATRL